MEDVDDQIPVWVRILVTYESEQYPGIPQTVMQDFIDHQPEMPVATEILQAWTGTEAEIQIWRRELPEPQLVRSTHLGPSTLQ